MKKTHVIIGSSAAGMSALNKIRQLDPHAELICITAQAELPYNKCLLADHLAGLKTEQQILTATAESLQQKNIHLLRNTLVTNIEPTAKRVTLSDGQIITYDSLFLGLGTSAFVPPIAGAALPGVFTFHTLADAQNILAWIALKRPRTAVVIGAGLSGLEAADALANQGVAVTVVERGSQLLANQVDARGSALIERCMQARGVAWYPQQTVAEIMGIDSVATVILENGKQLPADMVIVAAGARTNSALALQAGLALQQGGVIVDDQLMTSAQDIYAGGDLVVVRSQLTGELVPSCTCL